MSVYSRPPAEICRDNRARNQRCSDLASDANNELATYGAVTFHHEGRLLEVHSPGWFEQYEGEKKKKGKLRGFSNKSRLSMMRQALRLKRNVDKPLMATLTYPGKSSKAWPEIWPQDFETWKLHLKLLFLRLNYKFPRAASIWKLEFQKRGAPHFHLLIFNVPYLPASMLARWWYEIVGSEDEDHLEAGVECKRVHSLNGVLCYVGKAYMGKAVEGGAECGRFWGIRNRKHYPFSAYVRIRCARHTSTVLKRTIKRFMRSKGYRPKHGQSYVTSNRLDQWAQWGELVELYYERAQEPF